MATCSGGTMQRSIVLRGAVRCVHAYASDSCDCECFGEEPQRVGGRAEPGRPRSTCAVSGLPLGQVAGKFDRLLARDVLVPASARPQEDGAPASLKGVTVSAAMKALGLRTQKGRAAKPRPSKRRAKR